MVSAMHGLGYEPVYKGVIAGLQGGSVSYFEALKVLVRALDTSGESVERAQGIGERIGPEGGTSINGEQLLLAQLGLYEIEGMAAGVIGDISWNEGQSEAIASKFFREKGESIAQQCMRVLYNLRQSRLDVNPLKERNPDIICHVSNAIVALADAIALMRGAHTLATGNVVVEESSEVTETKRRIMRCINASYSAVSSIPYASLCSSIETFYCGGPGEKIREMAYAILKEASALSDLIRDNEGEVSRKSVSGAFFVAEGLLQRIAKLPVLDCSTTAFCTSVVRAAMKCAYDEHKRNTEGTHQSDNEVGAGHCLSIMLVEAAANACNLDSSMSAVVEAPNSVELCKIVLHDLMGMIGISLATLRDRSLVQVKSLGNANVLSYITGLVADALLLLEAIDVSSLPNPELHGELLNNVRKTLCETASICIKQQCAGSPEYSVPAECDCDNPQEWDFPSTNVEAAYPSVVADSMGYHIP
ncbi:hypothetical protein [Anaplasma phagocytophilum]|uniref:HGE-14 protein n=1 Tax=Anaplasma phagocytophilum str. CRT38 TaxID=1269275 RepID=S6GAL0_ANAPH|nr:hypothetical protein [Anaplasma phagocytophilum]EOA62300.1 hypothetical protein CRT38_03502 [Anaplasma phagocytophilum str. CRT38]